MKVLIIGWYGTETLGDRAILAGIFSQLRKSIGENVEISLGSLFPFFSERTIKEDAPFYSKFSDCNFPIKIVSTKNIKELEKSIDEVDMVLMGGGPLMHISQLYIIEYAFKYARKKKKSTVIYGCGIGPMHKKRFVRSLKRLLNHTDEIILRDKQSVKYLENLYGQIKWNIHIAMDPAVQAVLDMIEKNTSSTSIPKEEYIAINLRRFPTLYGQENSSDSVHKGLIQLLDRLSNQFECGIELIPMHYFHVGDDDREILNEFRFKLNKDNITVQNIPLNLEDTLSKFQNAKFYLGMRFHSVVFQTLINGRNYILDYTEKNIGKISGFLGMIDKNDFYNNRYISLRDAQMDDFNIDWSGSDNKFSFDREVLQEYLDVYSNVLARHV